MFKACCILLIKISVLFNEKDYHLGQRNKDLPLIWRKGEKKERRLFLK